MMLDHLGEGAAAARVMAALEGGARRGRRAHPRSRRHAPRTGEVGDELVRAAQNPPKRVGRRGVRSAPWADGCRSLQPWPRRCARRPCWEPGRRRGRPCPAGVSTAARRRTPARLRPRRRPRDRRSGICTPSGRCLSAWGRTARDPSRRPSWPAPPCSPARREACSTPWPPPPARTGGRSRCMPAPQLSTPAVAGGVVYVGVGAPVDDLVALSAATGQRLWSRHTDASGWVDAPTVAGGRVFVATGAARPGPAGNGVRVRGGRRRPALASHDRHRRRRALAGGRRGRGLRRHVGRLRLRAADAAGPARRLRCGHRPPALVAQPRGRRLPVAVGQRRGGLRGRRRRASRPSRRPGSGCGRARSRRSPAGSSRPRP